MEKSFWQQLSSKIIELDKKVLGACLLFFGISLVGVGVSYIKAAPIDNLVLTFQTTLPSQSVTIPTIGGGYNYNVDWGDGTNNFLVTGDASHVYLFAGTYDVEISGTFPRIYFNGDCARLIDVKQWGTTVWTSMEEAFKTCSALTGFSATDTPNLSSATSMKYMLSGATSFASGVTSWNTSNVTDMIGVFFGNSVFNDDISGWNVSAVTTMKEMFSGASIFNQNIGGWTVSAVTDMANMFNGAAAFNQSLNSWNVSAVTTLNSMFNGATAFNGDLSSWNTSSVTNMNSMFNGAAAFNQNIGSWTVSAVTDMANMFNGAAAFNQSLNSWNVSAVTTLNSMFNGATAFNGDISSWNTSSATDMNSMFNGAAAFNQNIGSWTVSAVTDMANMFNGAAAFNQNLGNWDISSLSTAVTMFTGATAFLKSNYDSLLTGWNTLSGGETQIPSGVSLGAGSTKYCAGSTARANLISTYSWSISDGGEGCPAPSDFVLSFQTTMPAQSVTIPTTVGTYNYNVDWGDGTVENGLTKNASHVYLLAGTYEVVISGTFPQILFEGNCSKLVDVKQWGSTQWASMERSFAGCGMTNFSATDVPDLSNATSMESMFESSSFNGDLNNWNVGNITNMQGIFKNASSFNGNVADWDISNVTNLQEMFNGATSFDKVLENWDISSVVNMTSMFNNSGLSSGSYDKILIGWGTLSGSEIRIPSVLTLGADGIKYCKAGSKRQALIDTYIWTINDSGIGENCEESEEAESQEKSSGSGKKTFGQSLFNSFGFFSSAQGDGIENMNTKEQLRQIDRGFPGKVITYTNSNGYEIFSGYISGRLSMEKLSEKRTIVRKIRRRKAFDKKEITVPAEKNATSKSFFHSAKRKNLKRRRAGEDEYKGALVRKAYLENKVNKFKRVRKTLPKTSMINIEKAENIFFRVGGKTIRMNQ